MFMLMEKSAMGSVRFPATWYFIYWIVIPVMYFLLLSSSYADERNEPRLVDIDSINARLRRIEADVVSLDCSFRTLMYVGTETIKKRGGHLLDVDATRQHIKKLSESWRDGADPDKVHSLSEDMGVTTEYLDTLWGKGRIVWEPGKVMNTLVPYSEQGNPLEAAFDGVAEWMHLVNSKQITVYDHSPKLGHLSIHDIRPTPVLRGEWELQSQDERVMRLHVVKGSGDPDPRDREVTIDKATGALVSSREAGRDIVHEYYADDFMVVSLDGVDIPFPRFAASIVFVDGKLFTGDFFFITSVSVNQPVSDSVYGLSAPRGTLVLYAGDLWPGEEVKNRASLASIRVSQPLADVRELLPGLRKIVEEKTKATVVDVVESPSVSPKEESWFRRFGLIQINIVLGLCVIVLLACRTLSKR